MRAARLDVVVLQQLELRCALERRPFGRDGRRNHQRRFQYARRIRGLARRAGCHAGTGVNQFSALWAVFVDPAGHIHLTDSGNSRVVRVDDMTGTNWTTYGSMGIGVGGFYAPTGIFVDANGRIDVIDAAESVYGTDDGIVRMDDMTGKNWLRFGRYGGLTNEFHQATGVWVH
jgi:hypothetical protein